MSVLAMVGLLTPRDRRIIDRARALPRGDFGAALDNLERAVSELIPAGRIWLLAPAPVVGSLITGVGLQPAGDGVLVVLVRDGEVIPLERFW